MKKLFAVLALLFCTSLLIKAQSTGEQHSFTLSWQANTTINSTFAVHSLSAFDNQPASSSVCGQSPEGYNVWCGEVVHYGNPNTFDFNFPNFSPLKCNEGTPQTSIVYTSVSRRTVTDNLTFTCTDPSLNTWTVQTTVTTYQYRAAQRYFYYWYNFPAGQQPPITGTVLLART